MIFLLAKHRFLSNIFTFRFTISFVLCVILFAASTVILVQDYVERLDEYKAVVQRTEDSLKTDYYVFSGLHVGIARPPSPLSVFCEGADKRLGVGFDVGFDRAPTIAEETNTRNPLLMVFPSLDVMTIVEVILSLLVIFLAYNVISGEREQGTLKLVLSNTVPRHTVLLGSFIGSMASVILPLIVGMLISLIIINLNPAIALSGDDYIGLILLCILAVLFLSSFFSLGMLLSSRIRRSSTVLILMLVVWVVTVVILPNTAVYLAQQVISIPDKATIDRQAESLRSEWVGDMNRYAEEHPWPAIELMRTLSRDYSEQELLFLRGVERQREVYTGSWPYAYTYYFGPREMVEWYLDGSIYGHNLRMDYEDRIWKLYQDYQRGLERQAGVARALSLISPSWSFYHAGTYVAYTGEAEYLRFLESADRYRSELITYMKNNGGLDSYLLFTRKPVHEFPTARELLEIRKTRGEEAVNEIANYKVAPLDLSGMPRFSVPGLNVFRMLSSALPELLILIFFNMIFFLLAWVTFLRADVR